MSSRPLLCVAIATIFPFAGCGILINQPANGSQITTPEQLQVTSQGGSFAPYTVTIDGNNLTNINGNNYQLVPSTMYALTNGAHTLVVSGTGPLGYNSSATSTFTVTASPLSYSCPTGYVHAFFVQCCNGNRCDVATFTNFGWSLLSAPFCQSATSNNCIGQNAWPICGASAPSTCSVVPESLAASFVAQQTAVFSQIQMPITSPGFPNISFQVWITNDHGGVPGTIVEGPLVPSGSLPPPHFPVVAPLHIFSVARPTLTAGQTYWLVVAPAAANSFLGWNFSLADSTNANGSNFLVNGTAGASGIPTLAGPWKPAQAGTMRPAFEIDVR